MCDMRGDTKGENPLQNSILKICNGISKKSLSLHALS